VYYNKDDCILLVRRKKAYSHWFTIPRDTRNRDRKLSSDQAQLFNIGPMDSWKSWTKTAGQAYVKLSLLRRVSIKNYNHREATLAGKFVALSGGQKFPLESKGLSLT
jgi:hypothetical protein